MARKPDYSSFYQLVKIIIAALVGVTKFLIEVNKHGLWKECIISVSIFCGLNYGFYSLYNNADFHSSLFYGTLIVSIIAFCVYWSHLFNKSPYQQFSQNDLKRNSNNWSVQSWWWSLDGWQFEQEVAKIFILNGYKATVTKGSGDGGVDIILENEGYKAIVQCKHYQNPVPPEPIRALWGCKDDFNANEVILIASSGITQAGADFVRNKPNFKVFNLDDVINMSNQAQILQAINSNSNQTQTKSSSNTKTKMGRKLDM